MHAYLELARLAVERGEAALEGLVVGVVGVVDLLSLGVVGLVLEQLLRNLNVAEHLRAEARCEAEEAQCTQLHVRQASRSSCPAPRVC